MLKIILHLLGSVFRSRQSLATQRFTHHAGPLTTTAYTHPSDEELYEAMRGMRG